MNKIVKAGGLKIVFAFIFIGGVFATQASAQLVSEILNRIDARSKALTSLKANLKLAKLNPQTGESDTRDGVLMFINKAGKGKNAKKDYLFRLDWLKPVETLAVADGKFIAYTPDTHVAHTGAANQAKAEQKGGSALSFLTMSKKELQDNYTAELVSTNETLSGGIVVAHLKFTPKTTGKYKLAEIWVDANGLIHQAAISPKAGDDSVYRFTGIQDNPKLDPKAFVVKLPKGTTIQPV